MSNTKLNELYRLVSGHTLVDFDLIINNLKEMPVENRLNYIGKYLYSVPGGIGNNYIGSQFRSELYKVLGENSIFLTPDIDKDSNINQEDYYRIILEQIDINNDNRFTVDDIEILKLLSTEPISEELGDGKENGHYYVDLGLPSKTMWATCNIGADKVTDSGLLFQWGRVNGYKYGDANHKFRTNAQNLEDGSTSEYIPITSSGKTYDKNEILDLADDAAHVNMGGKWMMPTQTQYSEMFSNTTCTVIKDLKNKQKVIGMLFTSKINNKRLFVPFAGYWYNGSFASAGSHARVWSSQVHPSDVHITYGLSCGLSGYAYIYNLTRSYAFSVRGVFQV